MFFAWAHRFGGLSHTSIKEFSVGSNFKDNLFAWLEKFHELWIHIRCFKVIPGIQNNIVSRRSFHAKIEIDNLLISVNHEVIFFLLYSDWSQAKAAATGEGNSCCPCPQLWGPIQELSNGHGETQVFQADNCRPALHLRLHHTWVEGEQKENGGWYPTTATTPGSGH